MELFWTSGFFFPYEQKRKKKYLVFFTFVAKKGRGRGEANKRFSFLRMLKNERNE
jgi:hypothetical protein